MRISTDDRLIKVSRKRLAASPNLRRIRFVDDDDLASAYHNARIGSASSTTTSWTQQSQALYFRASQRLLNLHSLPETVQQCCRNQTQVSLLCHGNLLHIDFFCEVLHFPAMAAPRSVGGFEMSCLNTPVFEHTTASNAISQNGFYPIKRPFTLTTYY